MAGGGLDLFQLAFVDEAKGGVDRLLQVVPVDPGRRRSRPRSRRGPCAAPGAWLRRAPRARPARRRAGRARPPRPACRQHALYFLPLPQGQRSLRPGLAIGVERLPSEDASLYATLLADARFHDLLLAVDRDLAEACRTEGCACGGRRHMARYARKPRGRPCRLGPEHDQRFSFCCAVDGCRSRATPPSLRFLGRRVYVATVVVLIAILQHGVSDARLERLSEVVSVDRRTIARWRRWWRDTFTATPFWRMARAALHAAARRDAAAGGADRPLRRRRAGSAGRPAALSRPGHRRRPHARFLTGAADPQSMLVAGVRTLCLRSSAP